MNRKLRKRKKELFSNLKQMQQRIKGREMQILEIGAGCGTNFEYYPEKSTVICVEPKSTAFNEYLRANAAQYG